ncbi:hypothetical protein [Streptomyces sp. NPDC006691]|uniref:hypothetical protein n=1 Tax=Streptomyces sp. NPDC006691 TaxID=3364757 RepID=UPI003690895C
MPIADCTSEVTLLIPRRTYAPMIGRLLHGRTADTLAEAVGRLPHMAATIVPLDVATAVKELQHSDHHAIDGEPADPKPPHTAPAALSSLE